MQALGIGWVFMAITLIALGLALVVAELISEEAECFGPGAVFFLITGTALWFIVSPLVWPTPPIWLPGLSLVLVAVTAIFSFVSLVLLYKIVQLKEQPPMNLDFIGGVGRAVDTLEPGQEGYVHYRGEYWRAKTTGMIIESGQRVRIRGKSGLILLVEPEVSLENE